MEFWCLTDGCSEAYFHTVANKPIEVGQAPEIWIFAVNLPLITAVSSDYMLYCYKYCCKAIGSFPS